MPVFFMIMTGVLLMIHFDVGKIDTLAVIILLCGFCISTYCADGEYFCIKDTKQCVSSLKLAKEKRDETRKTFLKEEYERCRKTILLVDTIDGVNLYSMECNNKRFYFSTNNIEKYNTMKFLNVEE